jgi:capsular exopolysaccharide synthesis family protein
MNEELASCPSDRSASKARSVAKLNRYRDLLVRRWWVLAAGLALGLLVEAGLWWLQPMSFISLGRMIVSIKLAIPEGSVYNEELSNFLGTQTALMQSGAVVNRAHLRVSTQNPGLTNQPVALRVLVSPKTSIFVLEAAGLDAAYVQRFLQAVMDEYINLKHEMRTQTSDTTVAGLTEEVLRLEKELRKGEEELVQFQKSNGAVLLQELGNSTGNCLAGLNQRLAGLKSELDLLLSLSLDQNLEHSHVGAAVPISADPSESAGSNPQSDLDYLKAKQQILLLKAEQEDLAQYLRPKHPKMLAMSDEIARRERLVEIYRKQSAEQLENRKTSLTLQISNLEKEIQESSSKVLDVSQKSAEYQRLKANSQRVQSLYDRLLATMQTLDVNKEVSPESVTVMEPASPAFPDQPKHTRRMVTAAVIAMLLSLGLLLFLDRFDDRVNSFTELQDSFDEPVLGQIPRQKPERSTGQIRLIQPEDDRHSFVEAYRNLRSSLLYTADGGQQPRTLLLTSSIPHEGKSLTSANLAITLANAGSRVLLVDADLRKGVLHNRFGLRAQTGLCEVLSRGLNWEEAIHPTCFPNLSLLPRGGISNRSGELFLSGATECFLRDAAVKYDFVLLDTAPIMAADDVTSLAPHMNAVLFVLRAEHTSTRVARAALDLLYQRRARVMGIIFNAVRPGSSDYYHYYKYKDYYTTYASAT